MATNWKLIDHLINTMYEIIVALQITVSFNLEMFTCKLTMNCTWVYKQIGPVNNNALRSRVCVHNDFSMINWTIKIISIINSLDALQKRE